MKRRPVLKVRGQALVPVLFLVLILTAFAVTMSVTARRETRAASNYLREVQQYYIARGAINRAAAELQQATNGGMVTPQLTPPPDTDANGWTRLGDGWYKVEIIDTASRVNINLASAETLARVFGNNAEIAAAILDWRDQDDQVSTITTQTGGSGSGAESDYYESLNPPYSAKNAPFDTVDELLLVRGITPEMLYGPGAEMGGSAAMPSRAARSRQAGGQPGYLNPQEGQTGPPVDTSGSTIPRCELLTTYSRERNVAGDGTPRVNIKTASEEDLQSRLGLSRQLAQRLVQYRQQQTNALNSIADLLNVPGFTRAVMQQIGDRITVTDAQYREGVLNINTAPVEALAAIPGVDETIYNAILEARQSGTMFTGLNDIFQLTALNRQQLQALVDHVCTKSSVYLVRVRVRVGSNPKVYAAQALVELPAAQNSTETPTSEQTLPNATILQWREVQRTPGWSSWITSSQFAIGN